MLTKNDLELIGGVVENIINVRVPVIVENIINEKVPKIVGSIVEPKFEEFAIMMKNRFDEIDERFEEIENKIDNKADKTDILRLENKLESRIERFEDNMRLVKTKLKIA